MTSSLNLKPRRSRKASALIAATAVLGIATVGTLATWTVTEYVSSTFRTIPQPEGSIEASNDNVTFGKYRDWASPLDLNWSADPEKLDRSQRIAASYYLRATAGTLSTVDVQFDQLSSSGSLLPDYHFQVRTFLLDSVDRACTNQMTILTPGVTKEIHGGDTFTLEPGTRDAAGTAAKVCITFQTTPTAPADSDREIYWQFKGTGQ